MTDENYFTTPEAHNHIVTMNELLRQNEELQATIERLEGERERLREALRPFSNTNNWHHNYDGSGLVYTGPGSSFIGAVNDLPRAVLAALTPEQVEPAE